MAKFSLGQAGPVSVSDWTAEFQGENREPVPFWDVVQRNFDDQRKTRNTDVRRKRFEDEINETARTLEKRLGKKLPRTVEMGSPSWDMLFRPTVGEAQYGMEMARLRAENPAAFEGIESPLQIRTRLDAEFRASRAAAEEGTDTLSGLTASIIGGTAGAFTDPEQAGMALATGGVGAGRSLLTRVLMQLGVGAATEAVQVPGRASDAANYGGPEYTAGEAIADIGFAAAGGAVFELGGEVVNQTARQAVKRFGGRLKAEPEAKGAVNALMRLEADEATAGPLATGGDVEAVQAALMSDGQAPVVPAERELGEIFGTGRNLMQPLHSDQAVAGVVTTEYQGRAIHSASFDPTALKVDAQTFQFKADGDEAGVTARLKGIERWDPTASGKVIVWEDQAGQRFIADGHQRRGLAVRLVDQGFEDAPRLDGFLFRESDGWSPSDVRVVAALKNIREGSGTILDAAKVFREASGAVDDRSLPVTGEFIQSARGLARLDDEAFGAVVNKVVPERYAAEIGALAANRPDLHGPMIRLMKEADPTSIEEARALVSEALLDDLVAAEGIQADLFGALPPQMTTIARAKIKASVITALKRDGRIYQQLVKNADIIEAGGNSLRRSENEARLQLDLAAAELVNKLSLRSGPIGEQFAAAAKLVTEGRRAGDVAKGLTTTIKNAIKSGELMDEMRAGMIDPRPAPLDPIAGFDDPNGAAAKAQIDPKPEDADIEADTDTFGLFDDFPDEAAKFETARTRLAACAPA